MLKKKRKRQCSSTPNLRIVDTSTSVIYSAVSAVQNPQGRRNLYYQDDWESMMWL